MRSTLILPALLAAALTPLAHADAIARFTNSAQGWTVYADGKNFTWDSDTGNPPGSIYAADAAQGTYWGFSAGPAFLGDHSNSIGGTLSWDLWVSGVGNTDDEVPDVSLISADLTLVIDIGDPADDDMWIKRSVLLSHTAGWKVATLDGPGASPADFAEVMSGLTELQIRAEYLVGGDHAWLDNVVMSAGDCYADCDGNGALDLFDFLCFVNDFNAGDAAADCDDQGGLDLFDFLCFVNAFNQGC
jgi:hypothetical protein